MSSKKTKSTHKDDSITDTDTVDMEGDTAENGEAGVTYVSEISEQIKSAVNEVTRCVSELKDIGNDIKKNVSSNDKVSKAILQSLERISSSINNVNNTLATLEVPEVVDAPNSEGNHGNALISTKVVFDTSMYQQLSVPELIKIYERTKNDLNYGSNMLDVLEVPVLKCQMECAKICLFKKRNNAELNAADTKIIRDILNEETNQEPAKPRSRSEATTAKAESGIVLNGVLGNSQPNTNITTQRPAVTETVTPISNLWTFEKPGSGYVDLRRPLGPGITQRCLFYPTRNPPIDTRDIHFNDMYMKVYGTFRTTNEKYHEYPDFSYVHVNLDTPVPFRSPWYVTVNSIHVPRGLGFTLIEDICIQSK